jgi:hypothetical protein
MTEPAPAPPARVSSREERAPHPAPVHVATRLGRHRIPTRIAIAIRRLAQAAAAFLPAEWMTRPWKFFNPSAAEEVIAVGLPLAVAHGTNASPPPSGTISLGGRESSAN